MKIVLDTTKETKYLGKVGTALTMLKENKCDTFIVSGANFICYQYEDRVLGERIHDITMQSLAESSVRYIIVCTKKDGSRLCLSTDFGLEENFNKAYYYNNEEYANNLALKLPKRLHLTDGDKLGVEEYLFHRKPKCPLRIYYMIHGLSTDYGLLQFIRKQIRDGILLGRVDKRGKPYILLDDLLLFKGEKLQLTSAIGVTYFRELTLEILLHDGLIAFNSISNFVKRHPDLDIPSVAHASPREGVNRQVFYDLGAVFYTNSTVQEVACREMSIANAWF